MKLRCLLALFGVALSARADDGNRLLHLDHYVQVRSAVPSIAGQNTQIYVRRMSELLGKAKRARTNRDWLYRSQRAWQPVLDEWDDAAGEFDEGSRALLGRTYRFLAPRYMPVTEWLSPTRLERKKAPLRQMAW